MTQKVENYEKVSNFYISKFIGNSFRIGGKHFDLCNSQYLVSIYIYLYFIQRKYQINRVPNYSI